MEELSAYAPLVRAMVRRYQGPGLEKEDLTQEAWLALVEARGSYCCRFGVRRPAYYKARVRAALADVLRRYRRDALCWRSSSEVELLTQHDELPLLLTGLANRQQQVLHMYYGEDKPLKEIALRLGLSISAVNTHKQRGLEALRRLSCSKK